MHGQIDGRINCCYNGAVLSCAVRGWSCRRMAEGGRKEDGHAVVTCGRVNCTALIAVHWRGSCESRESWRQARVYHAPSCVEHLPSLSPRPPHLIPCSLLSPLAPGARPRCAYLLPSSHLTNRSADSREPVTPYLPLLLLTSTPLLLLLAHAALERPAALAGGAAACRCGAPRSQIHRAG